MVRPSSRPRRTRLAWSVGVSALSLVALLLAAACSRSDAPNQVRAQPVTGVPTDIPFYPHVYYGGDDAYLVEGRWYRPGASGWVVFTNEPVELELVRKAVGAKPTE
jgi:hypothetical protein